MKVGILGGGQLSQMLMLAGYPLGIEVTCFDESPTAPASSVGTMQHGSLDEIEQLHTWAANVDVLTYEWENFPAELVADLAELKPMRPGPNAIAVAQDRWFEKRLFDDLDIPLAPFRIVTNEKELIAAAGELDLPLVAKTRTGGYDGKGQLVLRSRNDFAMALAMLEQQELLVERFVDFDYELSIIGVRGLDGEIAFYTPVRNEHQSGILHISTPHTALADNLQADAQQYATSLLKHLDYVGVLALELFVTKEGLLANEMAPRVHNSGHWTIEGATTSQFENHLRAITGLPLGSTELRGLTAMVNILGKEPKLPELLAIPGAQVHTYGKQPRPGRKLGHVTLTASTSTMLATRLAAVNELLQQR